MCRREGVLSYSNDDSEAELKCSCTNPHPRISRTTHMHHIMSESHTLEAIVILTHVYNTDMQYSVHVQYMCVNFNPFSI